MKICVAQIRPVKGEIKKNIAAHQKMVQLAASEGAGFIFFPELSLTGYEPQLARELATTENDSWFDGLQQVSNERNITIGMGMPLVGEQGILIGMVLLQAAKPRQVYYKQYLHEDENPFFVPGKPQRPFASEQMAIAICYELSVPEHAALAASQGASIYIASVAKTAEGTAKAWATLSAIAGRYSMLTLLSNAVGHCDDFDCGGKSAIWSRDGSLLTAMGDQEEGFLMIDDQTNHIIKKII